MKLWSRILKRILSDRALGDLKEDENRAIVEALVICVTADGKLTEEERNHLRLEIRHLPWSWDHESEIEGLISGYTDEARKNLAAGKFQEHAHEVARRLPHGDVRRLVYKMLTATAWTDGIVHEEGDVLDIFREGLELSKDEAQRILREVEHEHLPDIG